MSTSIFSSSRLWLFSLLALVSLLAANCKSTSQQKPVQELTVADNGINTRVSVGETFQVALNECVGCRYVWEITEMDTTVVAMVERTHRDRSCEDCTGGSLTRVFRFEGRQPGNTVIEMGYFDDTLRFSVEIYKMGGDSR